MTLIQSQRSKDAAGASEKTLLVLEVAVRKPRFTDIVEETGLAKTTVHRILVQLVEQGMLIDDPVFGYRPGTKLVQFAGTVIRSVDISKLARPLVDDLVDRTQNTVHLGVANGDEVLYLIRADSNKPYRMRSQVGATMPMHCTGMGKVILSDRDEGEIERFVARAGLRKLTEQTITSLDALKTELDWVKEKGYSLDLEENEPGVVCVSAPIRDYTGTVKYGISVSSITLEYPNKSIETLADDVVRTAHEISMALGWQQDSVADS